MAGGRWLFPLVSVSFVAVLLVLSAISGFIASSAFFAGQPDAADVHRGAAHPPAFAYYISGGRGDASRMIRLLLAVYHPRNRYLLHISADAPNSERADLAIRVRLLMPAVRAFENVDVVGKASAMTPMGSSELAARLHAASVLLRLDGSWDWFVTLNAADYPLVTQDDMIHVFSSVPRDFNFVDHTSDLGWKEYQRVQPIIVDAGIYLANRKQFFQASQKRDTPESFKFFTGSPWVILSRSFIEYSVLGWDNLPRTLLLYFTNVILSQEGYFHSVMCNSPDFQNTTINSNLRYMVWDNPPKMEPHFLNMTDFERMMESGMPFARQFHQDDPVLNKIDDKVLGRRHHQAVPGAWCSGRKRWWTDPCSHCSNANIMRPGPQAEKFGRVMKDLLDKWKSDSRSCKSPENATISS
ncbi:beta-glucuronosyltransferase GlcAT14A-like isoform X1 [Musa acuminata AAA Group]|uniref:beta-glucuronosyltransferase GlcAT14A-like isoform X1 n=1 Tax=Musa acuminata AAA Group TaxID=214697 RepID=UPI0031E437D0